MNDNDEIDFILGRESSNFLKIKINNYSYQNVDDYWDGNLLNARITLKIGGFTGDYVAQLRNTDFVDFKKDLEIIYSNLEGQVHFHDMEDYLQINISGDGLGHFKADCIATDYPGIDGNKLTFIVGFDQTEISSMTKMIEKIIENFPVRGNISST